MNNNRKKDLATVPGGKLPDLTIGAANPLEAP